MIVLCPACGTETDLSSAEEVELGVVAVRYDSERDIEVEDVQMVKRLPCPACNRITEFNSRLVTKDRAP